MFAKQLKIHADEKWGKGKLIDEIFGANAKAIIYNQHLLLITL